MSPVDKAEGRQLHHYNFKELTRFTSTIQKYVSGHVLLCPKYVFEDQISSHSQVAFRIGALELNQAAFPRNKHTFSNVYSDQVRVFVNEWHHYFKHLSTKFYM